MWSASLVQAASNDALFSSPLKQSLVQRILFSEACIQSQWAVGPDDTITLALGTSTAVPCRAEVIFHEAIPMNEESVIGFKSKGTRLAQYLRLELREKYDENARGVKTPAYRIPSDWNTEGLRLQFWDAARRPKKLSSLAFLAYPSKDGQLTTIHISGIRIRTPSLAAKVEMRHTEEPPLVSPVVVPSPKSFQISKMPSLEQLQLLDWQKLKNTIGQMGMSLLVLSLVAFALKRKILPRRVGALSPLYEINFRTWKSYRDANGVAQIGGLRSLTAEDLQDIRDAGFQSIWLMGLWEVGPRVRAMSKQYGEDFHGSPYAIYDYKVAQELGTEEELNWLVSQAHRIGLGVIVDFVPNHLGLDTCWLNEHPEFFLHKIPDSADLVLSDDDLKQRYPGYFPYRTPAYPENGRRVARTIMVAYGRDPHFFPWIDTAQLDYANPALREHLTRMISQFAKRFDGIRCDMAMLVLREQIKIHRHPEMSWDHFNTVMPNEFWSEAIQAAKKVNPNFLFIAETYWSLEGKLQELGFDYTYDKPLYEAMCHAFTSGHAEGLMNFLRVLSTDYMKRSVHFLENHDEERAMNLLGEDRQRSAAAMLCTLPGVALLHQGQMEGRRERLPVQRVVPLQDEKDNTALATYYKHLLHATALPVFQEGRLHVLYCNNPSVIAYARGGAGQQALVVINTSPHLQRGNVFLTPGLRMESGYSYWFQDLFYDLKRPEIRKQETVQPAYQYPASQLVKHGMYVELQPFDAHIFLIAPDRMREQKKQVEGLLRRVNTKWQLPLPARRLFGHALTRSVDASAVAPNQN